MASTYGLTWWGKEWLRSLDNIDYSNRLPRGMRYARNGSVLKLSIKSNIITASVQGSRVRPYRVTIVVPPFFEDDIKRLMDELLQRPTIISRLLNRELDPEVLAIAQRLGLKVFPQQWTDFKMQCSCPDWAVPCKHLAAVIYTISHEIDNNPFIVFELHRVDLLAELKKRGIHSSAGEMIKVPEIKSMMTKAPKGTEGWQPSGYRPDFTTIPDLTIPLINLLASHPPFYPQGDFKTKYAAQLLKAVKVANDIINNGKPIDKLLGGAEPVAINHYSEARLLIDDNLQSQFKIIDSADAGAAMSATPAALMASLHEVRIGFISDYQPSLAALKLCMACALNLLAHGAVIPQLIQLHNKCFDILWTPARIDKTVAGIIDKLEAECPPHIVRTLPVGKKREVSLDNAATWIVSVMLTEMIGNCTASSLRGYSDVYDMFFTPAQPAFDGVGQSETPGAVKSWLDRYSITLDGVTPIFAIAETLTGLSMSVKLEYIDNNGAHIIDLPDMMNDDYLAPRQLNIYKSLSSLIELIPELEGYLNANGAGKVNYRLQEFAPVLMEAIPTLRLLGAKVVMPKALQDIIRPRATMMLTTRDNDSVSMLKLDQLLDFDWRIALGNNIISRDEFMSMMANAHGLMRFKNEYIYIDEADMKRLQRLMSGSTRDLGPAQLLQIALSGKYENTPVLLDDSVKELVRQLSTTADEPLPDGLNATLRPYQRRGFSWMWRNMQIGFGSIIADDMGLGKTLQVITLILHLRNHGNLDKERALVVVPTGLLSNWETEFARFAPSIDVFRYHGLGRDLKQMGKAHVLLTSYGVMRGDCEQLRKIKWALMVIDEAQNIKNSNTAQSEAARSIKASTHIAMSGTPVENRLAEFWTIMDYANKGYLGTEKQFSRRFASPIQLTGDEQTAAQFRAITAPFIMRRLKTDKSIISDLPDKLVQNDIAQLTPRQAALYVKTLDEAMAVINSIDDTDAAQLFRRQGLVLQMITALKQICNHPAQYLKNDDDDPALSGKATMLLDLVEAIVDSGEKALIFTQYREMGALLQGFIAKRLGSEPLFYHGGCSIAERNNIVDRFQHNRADRIAILSLKAAGTGLNLTAASHVIHYDLWWNPAVEAQATDRAYRIGQDKNVIVHRFITRDTFEERIDAMIQSKKALAEMTVTAGENWIGHLSNRELTNIFSLQSSLHTTED